LAQLSRQYKIPVCSAQNLAKSDARRAKRDSPGGGSHRSKIWELFRLMKECRSIAVLSNQRKHIRQDVTDENRFRRSHLKASSNPRNRHKKLLRLTTECKSIEVIHNIQKQMKQESKGEILVQMSNSTDSRKNQSSIRKLSRLMQEYASIEVMCKNKTQVRQDG
jgi:hypothetical protein